MAVIPEELIDRASLNPNMLPTEAEARDGAQAMSENNVSKQSLASVLKSKAILAFGAQMCRFWTEAKDQTKQQ